MKILKFLFLILAVMACNSSKNQLVFDEFKKEIGVYEPLFINFGLKASFENPNDQDEVKVSAHFITPEMDTLVLPCFYNKSRTSQNKWEARFMPRQVGEYSFYINYAGKNSSGKSEIQYFTVNESEAKGKLAFDLESTYFLKFDNGERFRGVGLNVGWEYEPKWDEQTKHTFETYFDEMAANKANFLRMWICPWNLPIEWSPVISYQMLTEEYDNWDHVFARSEGLEISEGPTSVTQNDVGQLLKISDQDQFVIYQLEAVRNVKMMIYYKGEISKDDVDILYSNDNVDYQAIKTEYSDGWESFENWHRIFLYSYDEIPQPAQYIKLVFKQNVKKDNYKIAGIQFRYGNAESHLDTEGLGKYSVKNSERLDQVLDLAGSKGIHMMITLGYHSVFNPRMDNWGANDEWQRNPYSVKNGGPCKTPAEFFSNDDAKRHYKNYLRYFVARWGYNPAVVSWEFWNEVDIALRGQKIPYEHLVQWHEEMADYLKSIDLYNHITTTSVSHGDYPELWQIKNIDLTHYHRYAPTDNFVEKTMEFIDKYNKPHVIGEYAVGWKGPGNDYTDERYEDEFHDGLWRGLFTPVPILPMSWWWDYHYDKNHYFHFAPLATVVAEMAENSSQFAAMPIEKPKGFDVLGLSSDHLNLVWIKRTDTQDKITLKIPVKEGSFQLRRLNTRTNDVTDLGSIRATEGFILLQDMKLIGEKDILLMLISGAGV